jgi:hypothetical protein
MCEQMGTEPSAEDMPVDFEDFPPDIQMYIHILHLLPARFDGFSGHYFGKDFGLLDDYFKFFDITDVQEKRYALEIVSIYNNIETKQINDKSEQKRKRENKGKRASRR